MSQNNSQKLTLQIILIVGAIFTGWAGDIFLKILGLNTSWAAGIVSLFGATTMGMLGSVYKNKAKKRPFEPSTIAEGNSVLITQGALLSLIPIMTTLCGDKTNIEQIATIFIGLAPLATGFFQANQISQIIDRLFLAGHYYLEELIRKNEKIRSTWLYQHLREHPASHGIDDKTLEQFSYYKLSLWASERKDINIYHTKQGIVAEKGFY